MALKRAFYCFILTINQKRFWNGPIKIYLNGPFTYLKQLIRNGSETVPLLNWLFLLTVSLNIEPVCVKMCGQIFSSNR